MICFPSAPLCLKLANQLMMECNPDQINYFQSCTSVDTLEPPFSGLQMRGDDQQFSWLCWQPSKYSAHGRLGPKEMHCRWLHASWGTWRTRREAQVYQREQTSWGPSKGSSRGATFAKTTARCHFEAQNFPLSAAKVPVHRYGWQGELPLADAVPRTYTPVV